MRYRFYKNEHGDWYVDLPNWPGDIEELQMVAGADMFCERLAEGRDEVSVYLSPEEFEGSLELSRSNKQCELGSYYWTEDYLIEMWLCPVTEFVFGGYPAVIYYSK